MKIPIGRKRYRWDKGAKCLVEAKDEQSPYIKIQLKEYRRPDLLFGDIILDVPGQGDIR